MILLIFILIILLSFIIIINCINTLTTGGSYKITKHNSWEQNIIAAKSLLNDEFKDLYNDDEREFILKLCSGELECNIWNDFIDEQYFYNRPYSNVRPYYPEYFLITQCYFRKFFIARLQVLTRFYKPHSVILYVGAANSTFLPLLIELFPTYTWHIYEDIDLSYKLIEEKNVHLYKEKLTIEEGKKWRGKIDVFISDYRRPVQDSTISLKKEDTPLQERVDKMMLEDVMFNIELIRKVSPKIGACLKFRAPVANPSSSQSINIMKGKILWLPWSSNKSMDGTLVIDAHEIKNNTNMNIYLATVQNSYATHNRFYRAWGYYTIPNDFCGKKINGFCNCFDCVCEFTIISNYIKLGIPLSTPFSVADFMNKLSYKFEPLIDIRKKHLYHGRFPSMLPAIRIKHISSFLHIGKYANISINNITQYYEKLKKNADLYDEFAIDGAIECAIDGAIDGKQHKGEHFDTNTIKNLSSAKNLLSKKYKYNNKEEKIILATVSKIHPLPSIWNDLKNVMVYRGDKDKMAHNDLYCHLGQRKLFMAELHLLTRFLPDVMDSATILYAGAAAGYHIPLLFQLFPNTVWHLYDPAPFCKKLIEMNSFKFVQNQKRRVYLYNEYFTDDVANSWHNKCDLFISDIRLSADTRDTFESQVESDMRMQERWTLSINPKLGASLKFRPPYLDPGVKLIYTYSRGQIMWQMWPPRNSTECRLIIDARDLNTTMKLDVVKYQNACAFHNIIDRAWKAYELPDHSLNKVIGYDRCFDCTCEAICWGQYRELKNAKKQPLNKYFDNLTHITHQTLKNKKSMHGYHQYDMAAVRLSKF